MCFVCAWLQYKSIHKYIHTDTITIHVLLCTRSTVCTAAKFELARAEPASAEPRDVQAVAL